MDIVYFAVIVAVLWLLVEILSVIFKITGLDLYKARFQVISILTHTGFTTRESELIAQHPLRRRLASILMLVSYIAQASLISVMFSMVSQNAKQLLYIGIALAVILVLYFVFSHNKYISGKVNRAEEKLIAKRFMKNVQRRSEDQVLKISPEYAVYELLVDSDSPLANVTLRAAKLNERFISVLKIDRGSATLDFPKADTVIQPGDVLIVYGKIKFIKELMLEPEA